MALLSSVLPPLLWVVVVFQVVQSIDSESVQPAKGEKTVVICENYHDDIQCPYGKIAIKNAYYGRKDGHTCPNNQIKDTNCKAANSTDFIRKKCEKNAKCHLEATNSIFGDPCVNTYKYISVDYICEGHNIHSELICENDSKKISCPEGTAIKIKNASYGRKDGKTCFSKSIKTTDCTAETSLSVVNKKCDNQKECTLEATNSWFTDPCAGTYKYLYLEYQCVQAHNTHSELICENNSKKISCPEGMSIKIKNASYGRMDNNACYNENIKTTNCRAETSLSVVNKRCENMNECTLEATNSWFTDPCAGTYKYLSVEYQCVQAHNTHSELICENNSKKISCPEGMFIKIKNASYGRMDNNACYNKNIKTTNCRAETSLSVVNKRCENMNECTLEATNSWFTDPCAGTYKYLSVEYQCVQAHNTHSELICENNSKKISCPEGMFIKIKNASYGRMDNNACYNKNIKTTNCRAETSLSVVNKRCENMNECTLEATNSWFTDPCAGTYKYLSVEYQCVQAHNTHSELICENNSKKISCPEGMFIKIKNASYGRMDNNACYNKNIKTTNCRAETSLSVVNKRCENMNECTLEATNSWFTDPCAGTYKYLSVEYQCVQAHNTHSELICENNSKKISCPEGMSIKIKNASYGRMDNNACYNKNIKTTNCRAETSLSVVNKRCENMNECTLEATNSWFTDPCAGTYKYLSVEYQCVQAHNTHSELICENNSKKISCPEGMSIKIKNASYGRMDNNACYNKNIKTTNCRAETSLSVVNKRCENMNECTLEATNSWFTDPCAGTYKYLSVEYQCVQEKPIDPKNKTEIITVCESTNAQKITCPKGTSLFIEDALYGRLNKNVCPHAQMSDTQCKAGNAFQIVNNRCKGKAECELQATNSWFGDPCVNTNKYLQVKYKCVKESDITNEESEIDEDDSDVSSEDDEDLSDESDGD